jgi:basic amino acid/polyamine antiporter, APA family
MSDAKSRAEAPEHQIGLVACVAFCVGTMIGGGVFTLSGTAVDMAGPAAIAAYAIAGVVMLLSALSFVVVSARSKAGDSGYAPIGDILGAPWRFLVMWGFYLNAVMVIAFLLVSFSQYLAEYFVPNVPEKTAALVALALIALLNLGPADLVGKAETWLVGLKVSILLLLVAFGLAYIGNAQFTPFMPNGTQSLLAATAMLFTAYTGFNVVTNMAGSVKNPQRTVPLAIMLSIGIAATIYIGVAIALLASGQSDFGSAGLGKAAAALMGHWGEMLVAFAALISTLTGANANVLGASELTIRLAKQGDISPRVARLSKRGHPVYSVVLGAAIGAFLVVISKDAAPIIVGISNVTAIVAMVVVDAAAMRLAMQGWPGGGPKLPGGVLIPILGILAAVVQLPSLGWVACSAGAIFLLVGMAIYAGRHLGEVQAERDAIAARVHALETPLLRALKRPLKARA